MAIHAIARAFGLECSASAPGRTTLSRQQVSVTFAEALSDESPVARNRLLCACLGTRLGIDRRVAGHDVAHERQPSTDARNVYEQPSPYGERAMRLLPRAVAALAGRVGGFQPLTTPWVADVPFVLGYLLPVGRHLHMLGEDDVPRLELGRQRTLDDARRVSFYEAYSLRPTRQEQIGDARVSWLEAAGGRGSSLAALLPDFDFDTSRAHGVLLIPDYDRIITWRPGPKLAGAAVRDLARREIRATGLPFARRVYHLRPDGIVPGQTCDAGAEFDPSDLPGNLLEVAT